MKLKRPFRWWIWIVAGGACALLAAWVGVMKAFSGDMVRATYPQKLPPDYVYPGLGESLVRVEKGFFASAYGGWHGDGSEMLAYKIRPSDIPALEAGLKTKYPAYRWDEVIVRYSTVWYLAKQVPAEFRPAENARMLRGAPEGTAFQECYLDRQRGLFFFVSNRY